MKSYQPSCTYYCVIHNGQCVDFHLPDHILYQDDKFVFSNKESLEVQFIYLLDENQEMKIQYHVQPRVQVDIIETKYFHQNSTFTKVMNIDHDAIVHIFSENDCENKEKVDCYEEVHLQNNAICQVGYAELSDGSFEAKYQYYLDGEGANAKVRMAILSKEDERKNYEVSITHNKPHTYGQMDNYGVVKDRGRLTIDGIGTITKGQHGAASHQTNKIMVFDSECIASANPYLYIDEYDVKASHAAGVGKMDEEHLYYLQSRGLTKTQAMHLITYGYLKPVIEVVDNEMIKERFEQALSKVGA